MRAIEPEEELRITKQERWCTECGLSMPIGTNALYDKLWKRGRHESDPACDQARAEGRRPNLKKPVIMIEARWFAGAACAICGKPIEDGNGIDRRNPSTGQLYHMDCFERSLVD